MLRFIQIPPRELLLRRGLSPDRARTAIGETRDATVIAVWCAEALRIDVLLPSARTAEPHLGRPCRSAIGRLPLPNVEFPSSIILERRAKAVPAGTDDRRIRSMCGDARLG
jgi:hypothetical protein